MAGSQAVSTAQQARTAQQIAADRGALPEAGLTHKQQAGPWKVSAEICAKRKDCKRQAGVSAAAAAHASAPAAEAKSVAQATSAAQKAHSCRQDATDVPAADQKQAQAASKPQQQQPADAKDSQALHSCRAVDKASGSSQEQWETAISKLNSLAQKHSQGSQDHPPADIPGPCDRKSIPSCAEPGHAVVSRQLSAANGSSALVGCTLLPSVHGSSPQKTLGQPSASVSLCQHDTYANTKAALAKPVLAPASLPCIVEEAHAQLGAASMRMEPLADPPADPPAPRGGEQSYTDLSRLKVVTHQQKQQPALGPAHIPQQSAAGIPAAAQQHKLQSAQCCMQQQGLQQTHGMDEAQQPQQAALVHQTTRSLHLEQRQKRKRLESHDCNESQQNKQGLSDGPSGTGTLQKAVCFKS